MLNSQTMQHCDVDCLFPLFSAATHEASAAMSRWTGGLVDMSLDEVRQVPLEKVTQTLNIGDDLLTMVIMSVPGELGGEMILTFDENGGKDMAAALLGRAPSASGSWTDLEQSALMETGNILSGAYMNAVTRLVGVELVPVAPTFIQDYGASVLEQALMVQAVTSDQVLVCRTTFHAQGKDLSWNVFFVPSEPLRRAMEKAFS